MPIGKPSLVVLAGPNGAGKSTTAPALLRGTLKVTEFVNADVIARGLSGFQPEAAALAAGRVMLSRIRHLASEGASFAFESTLANRLLARWIAGLIGRGYRFYLVFLWLPSPKFAVERVAQRVQAGGHSVAEAVIRRRYESGLRNFFGVYQPLATRWWMYDNSETTPRLVASGEGRKVTRIENAELWKRIVPGFAQERHPREPD
jgi:predicted ABC-type ATPase